MYISEQRYVHLWNASVREIEEHLFSLEMFDGFTFEYNSKLSCSYGDTIVAVFQGFVNHNANKIVYVFIHYDVV